MGLCPLGISLLDADWVPGWGLEKFTIAPAALFSPASLSAGEPLLVTFLSLCSWAEDPTATPASLGSAHCHSWDTFCLISPRPKLLAIALCLCLEPSRLITPAPTPLHISSLVIVHKDGHFSFERDHIFYKIIFFVRLFLLGSQQNWVEGAEISHITHVPQRQSLPFRKSRLLFQLLTQVHFQIARGSPRCQLVYFERSGSIFWYKFTRPLVEEN